MKAQRRSQPRNHRARSTTFGCGRTKPSTVRRCGSTSGSVTDLPPKRASDLFDEYTYEYRIASEVERVWCRTSRSPPSSSCPRLASSRSIADVSVPIAASAAVPRKMHTSRSRSPLKRALRSRRAIRQAVALAEARYRHLAEIRRGLVKLYKRPGPKGVR